MDLKEYEKDALSKEQIDEVVTRVKAFLINSKNQVLVAFSNGGYQLPGGHIEKNEDIKLGLIREIEEETGITLNLEQISSPFFEINYFTPNYKNSGKNRQNKVLYFAVKNQLKPNLTNLKLTETEKKYGFKTFLILLDDLSDKLKNSLKTQKVPINKIIEREILKALEVLKQIKN